MKNFRQYGALVALLPLISACTGEAEPAPVIPAPAVAEEIQPIKRAEPEPAAIEADLAQIENATPAQVLAYVGEPALVRRDETVQVMTFETEHCVFEVIFYEPSPDDHFEARYINARDRTGRSSDPEVCLTEILAAAAAP